MATLSYEDLAKHPSTFIAFTSLNVSEFRAVLTFFGNAWIEIFPPNEFGQGHPPTIKSMQDRLLFILHFYKCNPIQEVLGYLFGISQERASVCIKQYTEVLCLALQKSGFAPERIPEELKKKLKNLQSKILQLTAQNDRSPDPKTQKD